MFPDIKTEHEWADEDIGMNCGRYIYYDGERVEEYFPESQKECLEFAAKVMDVSLEEDYALYLNASETGYVNIEYDDEYELVEIEDLHALFTNERITDADIPKGMYCYHLRHDDNGNFCAIEKNVTVNHAGSIITKEPIELTFSKKLNRSCALSAVQSPLLHRFRHALTFRNLSAKRIFTKTQIFFLMGYKL